MSLRSKLAAVPFLVLCALLSAGPATADNDDPVVPLDLLALRGKVVVVEVMETWCGACRSTVPTLNRWHARGADRGLWVVVASPETAESLVRYRRTQGLDAHAAVDPSGAFARRFEVDAYPTFIVLDRAGEPRGRFRGAGGNLERVEATFTELLGGPALPNEIRIE